MSNPSKSPHLNIFISPSFSHAGGLLSIVFIYYGCIAVAQALSAYYTRRLTSGIYLHINDTVSGQTKINHIRLNDISKQ